MKINKEWHLKNKMPANASLNQRIKWHVNHQKHCGCRAIPENILAAIKERKIKL